MLEEVCKDCYSYSEVLRRCGRIPAGGNFEILKRKIKEYNIDVSHFTFKLWSKGRTKAEDDRISGGSKYTEEEIFSRNSPFTRHGLRNYIIAHKTIEYKCALCGNDGVWFGKPIGLDLDHIDGNPENNELSNLRFLCPNCHATTETYRGKNKKKNKEIKTKEEA